LGKADLKIHKPLKDWFAGANKIVIAGIGNPIRRDDFVGVKVIQNLEGKISKNIQLIECGNGSREFS